MYYVFFISTVLLIYVYFIYPSIIIIISSKNVGSDSETKTDLLKEIIIVVPAHNEEKVLADKIENHLKLDYPAEKFSILIISDTSSDLTVEIANKYIELHPDMVSLVEIDDGKGKTNAINKALKGIKTDIFVFSDANVYLERSALREINNSLSYAEVGCVAGQLTYINENSTGASDSNGLYWRYEEAIKIAESRTSSMMGADGSIFAIKAHLFSVLPVYVLDDFCTSMGVVLKGYKLKINTKIKAFEKGALLTSEELSRKIRISNRSYNSYRYMRPELIKKLSAFDLWKFYSHKVLRWYSFLFMVFSFASHTYLVLMLDNPYWTFSYVLHVVFYAVGFLSWVSTPVKTNFITKIGSICEYFIMANISAGLGVAQSLLGKKIVTWKKAESTR